MLIIVNLYRTCEVSRDRKISTSSGGTFVTQWRSGSIASFEVRTFVPVEISWLWRHGTRSSVRKLPGRPGSGVEANMHAGGGTAMADGHL